jgi:hypothetical protein
VFEDLGLYVSPSVPVLEISTHEAPSTWGYLEYHLIDPFKDSTPSRQSQYSLPQASPTSPPSHNTAKVAS